MDTNETKLLKLLSSRDVTFFIPPYQRNYEWTQEQCSVFLEDVIKVYTANKQGREEEHFFGTITYFSNHTPFGVPDELVLIDGQQRITTMMLFLIALRDLLPEDKRAIINKNYLKNDNATDANEYKIKLKQVEADWEVYKKLIIGLDLEEKDKEAAVYKNYNGFKSFLDRYAAGGEHDLGEIIEYGLTMFSVVTIELEPKKNSWEDPQAIFESMNSLGKPLSLADLVRNYLLLGLEPKEQDELYKKYWLKLEREIPNQLSNFIRDYMQSEARENYLQATANNYKRLYADFKDLFADRKAATLLADMAKLAPLYAHISLSGRTDDKALNVILDDLRQLEASTAYSFFLMLLRDWQDGRFTTADMVAIFAVWRIYFMRLRLLGLSAAGNKRFPTLVKCLPELRRAPDKAQEMFAILASLEYNLRVPNDDELADKLDTMNFGSFKHVKFYLALIEEKLTRSRPNLTDAWLQLEHIMPQTLTALWREKLGPDAETIWQKYLDNIGNLTLIRHNQELSNKPFAEKLTVYKDHAGMQIAKSKIVGNDNWGLDEILARRKWIIETLLREVIPVPENMRHGNNYMTKAKEHYSQKFSFKDIGLKDVWISYIDNPNIKARVVDDTQVEFEGKIWKLSPLVTELKTRDGKVKPTKSYRGCLYWLYEGKKIFDLWQNSGE